MDDLRLIGFSGPPRSGKDTLGGLLEGILRQKHGVQTQVLALSLPMRLSVYAYLGLEYSVEHYEANKDTPMQVGGDKTTTIRNEMISLSESFVKPRLGHGWWGRALLNRATITSGVLIVTDMGFDSEVRVFEETLPCAWVHVHRAGHDFSKDSRDYVGKGTQLYNDEDPETAALRVYSRLVNRMGWSFDQTLGGYGRDGEPEYIDTRTIGS